MKKFKIMYWTATTIIMLIMGLGSFADILMIESVRESAELFGFPAYIVPYFGITKLLAAVVIVVPAFKRYKEVAYGGLFFYFVGAVYSHIAIGDTLVKTAGALIALLAVVVSYLCWLKLEGAVVKEKKAIGLV